MRKNESSSLEKVIDYFKDVPEIGVVEFRKEDIVRHPLIVKIEEIFEKNS
jgi:phosphate starvation-inducible protein PhoH